MQRQYLALFPNPLETLSHDCSDPNPVLIDRLLPAFTSQSPLFTVLPSEILNIVIQHLPFEGLASLALVNSDCLHAARSRQFCSLIFRYSDRDLSLIDYLLNETKQSNTTSRFAPLGAYVKAIRFQTDKENYKARHGDFRENAQKYGQEVAVELASAANALHHKNYVDRISKLVRDLSALPNLEYLVLNGYFMSTVKHALSRPTLKHLKLPLLGDDVGLVHVMSSVLSSISAPHIPALRSLELREQLIVDDNGNVPDRRYLDGLRPFANKLEFLSLTTGYSTMYTTPKPIEPAVGEDAYEPLIFSKLQRATINCSGLEEIIMPAILSSPVLTTLDIWDGRPALFNILNKTGTIPTLHHLTFRTNSPANAILPFIQANSQLTSLSFANRQPDSFLSHLLLPHLSQHFKSLRSLSLHWTETVIPESALYLISTLTTLGQLFLGAGMKVGWRCEWCIDHSLLRSHLRHLPLLRHIAYWHDTYDNGHGWSDAENYYQHRRMNVDVDLSSELDLGIMSTHERFEVVHRERMLREAQGYADVMPKLEWMFVGQYPIGTVEGEVGRSVTALSPGRLTQQDNLRRALGRTFGTEDETFGLDLDF